MLPFCRDLTELFGLFDLLLGGEEAQTAKGDLFDGEGGGPADGKAVFVAEDFDRELEAIPLSLFLCTGGPEKGFVGGLIPAVDGFLFTLVHGGMIR